MGTSTDQSLTVAELRGKPVASYGAVTAGGDARRNDIREKAIQRKYGLDSSAFRALVTAQAGRCANPGCRRTFGYSKIDTACVDHDHRTGVIRGLLCGSCNTALGLLHDNPQRIRGLVSYLRHGAVNANLGEIAEPEPFTCGIGNQCHGDPDLHRALCEDR